MNNQVQIKVIEHDSWTQFATCMVKATPLKGYFRGQSNPEWGLVPGAYRHIRAPKQIADDIDKTFSYTYIDLFKKYSSGAMTDAEYLPEDEDELVIWAQNYGLITPLLDWSYSPFVAAFFAYIEHVELAISYFQKNTPQNWPSGEVSIWHINTDDVPTHIQIVKDIPKRMHRQSSQGSVFMKTDPSIAIDIAKSPQRDPRFRPIVFIKHLIPAKDCFQAVDCLRTMNIHYASLFPDLFGAAKQSNVEFLCNAIVKMDGDRNNLQGDPAKSQKTSDS